MGDYKTNQIMYWGAMKCSDHNRAPLDVSFESIETSRRMMRGTKRKYSVTKKRTWSTSWENLPTLQTEVVDGGATGPMMRNFYETTRGAFTLTLRDGQGNVTTAQVMIEEFSYNVTKRGNNTDLWEVSVTLEEV